MAALARACLLLVLASCAVLREAGEAIAIGGSAAVGAVAAGPLGAVAAAAGASLAFKAARGAELQDDINSQVVTLPPTASALIERFWTWMAAAAILLLLFKPEWLVAIPFKALRGLLGTAPKARPP